MKKTDALARSAGNETRTKSTPPRPPARPAEGARTDPHPERATAVAKRPPAPAPVLKPGAPAPGGTKPPAKSPAKTAPPKATVKPVTAKGPAGPAPAPPPVSLVPAVPRVFSKARVDKAARTVLKSLRPLVADDEDDRDNQRHRLTLIAAHPRRRSDGHYEVLMRFNAGHGLQDPEADGERKAREFFDKLPEFAGIPVSIDVTVAEDRD